MAKSKKKRAEKYDSKLAIEGSFEDVIKVSVGKIPQKPPVTGDKKKGKK
ncbi:MAG: hypothetical protein H7Y42_09055 [Chitinophagaceae bacterium]|nr:hypothetical protein [Chitinophagaceae bacterium]